MRAVTDEQLIQWVADGDASCLGTLFERHHRVLYQYCHQLTRNAATSEDIVQEVFIKLLKKARDFRGQGSFKSWMFSIAHNVGMDYLRKIKRRGDSYRDEDIAVDSFVDPHSTERQVAGKQSLLLVAKALAELPATTREVIWLGRFVFDSYEELGSALQCSSSAARVRMHRAMQQLNATVAAMNGVATDV